MKYVYNQRVGRASLSRVWLVVLAMLYAVAATAMGSLSLQARGMHHDEGSSDSVIVISGNTAAGENQPGWMFNRDASTSSPYEFNMDEASIGDGSLYVLPIGANASDKFIGEYFYLDEVAKVDSIAYDFLTDSSSDAPQFYMNLYTNDGSDPAEFYDCRYNIVPTATTPDPVTGFTTLTYNLSDPATSVSQRASSSIVPCPAAPADLPAGAVLRAIALNVGDTSASDTGVDGYLDKVVITETDKTTTFDLDPYPVRGRIVEPDAGELVGDKLKLKAKYDDGDAVNDDAVQWAVRFETCAASTNTVFGNVDGHDDAYEWDGAKFSAKFDTADLEPGLYCFVFNPTDDSGQTNVRETQEFYIGPQEKADCEDDGWMLFGDNFDNERDCKKYVKKHSHNDRDRGDHHGHHSHHHRFSFFQRWWSWWSWWSSFLGWFR